MNRQIARLAIIGLGLIASLIVATTYWQTWATAGLADRQDNEIQRVAQFSIKRGLIRAADGTILATNRRRRVGGQTLYFRRYPQGALFANVVGYSTQSRARAGLEASENDYLTGSNTNLKTVIDRTLDKLRGATIKGNTLWLTLRPSAQRMAMAALNGQCGAAVAVDIRTGAVLVMATRPTYDPNLVESNFGRITTRARSSPCTPTSPLVNRATDGLFIPGSSFKVVTATAALDSGRYTPDSRFVDRGYCIEYDKQVKNFGDQNGPEVFGPVDFLQALEHSINAVFCDVGKAIGARSILNAAKRYGFYKDPPLETPGNERAPSGLYKQRPPLRPDAAAVPGRSGPPRVRPGADARDAAADGDGRLGGRQPRSRHAAVRRRPGDRARRHRDQPHETAQVPPRDEDRRRPTALNEMMQAVVTGGTGTAAQIPGVRVAGKTGTAETGGPGTPNTTWFIEFAPADNPRYAVAVVLQNQTGTGGTTAAPIAKEIMQALLAGRSNP